MKFHPSRLALLAAIPLAATAGQAAAQATPAQTGPVAHAAAKVRPGIYDCWSLATGMFEYMESYEFKGRNRYGIGSRMHGDKMTGKVDWGRYRMKGKKVIASSGQLKKDHYYLQIKNRSELVLMHNNHKPTGIGCYRYKKGSKKK